MFLEAVTEAETAAATVESLKSFVSVPIITTAVLALTTLVIPTVRWTRQLKSELAVFSEMPEGEEKNYWQQRVEEQSVRLRTYRTLVPWWDRLLGWLVVVCFALAISFGALFGIDTSWMAPFDWIIFIMGLFVGVYVTINTLKGGSFHGLSPQGYVSYIESERRSYRRAEARRQAGRRLRRIKRAERAAARTPAA